MRLKPRVVLHAPVRDPTTLEPFVDRCLRDRVRLIAIVGAGCAALEEEIDWLLVRDGFEPADLICTSSHPNETLEAVMAFASAWTCDGDDGVQEVRL